MSDTETTVTNWRTRAAAAWAFVKAHWVWCGPLIGAAVGYIGAKV